MIKCETDLNSFLIVQSVKRCREPVVKALSLSITFSSEVIGCLSSPGLWPVYQLSVIGSCSTWLPVAWARWKETTLKWTSNGKRHDIIVTFRPVGQWLYPVRQLRRIGYWLTQGSEAHRMFFADYEKYVVSQQIVSWCWAWGRQIH